MTQAPPIPADDQLLAPPVAPPTAPTRADATPAVVGTIPAVVAVTVVGVGLAGLFLVTADRWGSSAGARALATIALVTALLAVLAAVTGHLLATVSWSTEAASAAALRRARRGVAMILLAGVLSVVAVLSTGVAVLVVPQGGVTGDTEPTLTVRLAGSPAGRTVVVVVSLPGLAAGDMLNASLVGVDGDTQRVLLARTVVRVGQDGLATADLAATLDSNMADITVSATAGEQTCTASLSAYDATSVPLLTCRD